MKNIHILPTDKPSRLHLIEDTLMITSEYENSVCDTEVNVYITSDVEIKKRDWILDIELNRIEQCLYSGTFRNWKKIILTTDQDLIKDGVQDIDDEFLEWFVKNPSEEVEVVGDDCYYEIIMPKEEPKHN